MKIAFIGDIQSTHLAKLALEASKLGHSVAVYSQSPLPANLQTDVQLIRLPIRGKVGYLLNTIVMFFVMCRRRYDVINVHYASGYGLLAALSIFRPYTLTVWGSDIYDFPRKNILNKTLLKFSLWRAASLVATSGVLAAETRKYSRSEVEVVPFGVDDSIFWPLKRKELGQTVRLGTVKSLEHTYGIDILIKSFAKLNSIIKTSDVDFVATLEIVGDGSQEAELKALVHELNLSDVVRFRGKMQQREVADFLREIDLYIALSRQESFGVSLLEAYATCTPAITSSAPGFFEVSEGGRLNVIVTDLEANSVANLIFETLKQYEKAVEISELAFRRIQEKFLLQNTTEMLIELSEINQYSERKQT